MSPRIAAARLLGAVFALLIASQALATSAAAQCVAGCAAPVGPGSAAYVQTGFGPATTGANTTSLIAGATGVYGFGSSGGLPLLRCDYLGEAYSGSLHGNYSLATTAPGNVTAIMKLGSTSVNTVIGNLLAGTNGAWWDAEMDAVCLSAGGASASVQVGVTITFQATGGVTAAQTVNRNTGPMTVPLTNGAFSFDLQRTFTNGANTMQIETLTIGWVR